MLEYTEAVVKSLVAVAWADGRMDGEESEVLEALAAAFDLSDADTVAMREYAKTPRTLGEIPLGDLSSHDRRMLLQHAVILTFVDGHQSDKEKEILQELVQKLRLPPEEADPLIASAEARAKKLAALL